jgi:hypothetical protein
MAIDEIANQMRQIGRTVPVRFGLVIASIHCQAGERLIRFVAKIKPLLGLI